MPHNYFEYVRSTSFSDCAHPIHCRVCSRSSSMGTPDRAAALLFQGQHCPCRLGAGAAPLRSLRASRAQPRGPEPGRAAQPSPLLTAPRATTAGFSAGRTPGPARPLRQPGHGELRQHRRGRRSPGRPCPRPAGDCGHPGALPPPAPDPGPLTRAARGQPGPQSPLPVHRHAPTAFPRMRAALRDAPLPFGASCPHPRWRSSPRPSQRGARITCGPARWDAIGSTRGRGPATRFRANGKLVCSAAATRLP